MPVRALAHGRDDHTQCWYCGAGARLAFTEGFISVFGIHGQLRLFRDSDIYLHNLRLLAIDRICTLRTRAV